MQELSDHQGDAGQRVEPDGHVQSTASHRGRRGRGASRGPTPELERAADELEQRLLQGEAVTPQHLQKIRGLLALDLIRSRRPTARAKGYEMLEGLCQEPGASSTIDPLEELGLR